MPNIICITVKGDMFFRLDELYAQCCIYAITHLCDFKSAQYRVFGRIVFAE